MNRRELLAASGLVVGAGIAGCNAPSPAEGTGTDDPPAEPRDWPLFLNDRTHRRCVRTGRRSVDDPTVRWTTRTDDAVWASPVVADGVLYVGSYDGHLYALDADTGDRLWRYRTGDRLDGSPAVANGTVYVGSFDRNVYAVDAATGEERWTYGTRGIVRSSPTVVDGVVYVGAFCRSEECNAYYDVRWPERGFLYALDADTGALRWRYETGDGVISTPAVDDGTVYVGSSDRHLYAFDAATGETRWRHETTGPVMSSPTCVDGRVHVGNVAGRLYALTAADGEHLWTYDANRRAGMGVDLPVAITGSPLVCEGTLYVGSMFPGDQLTGKFLAIDAAEGTREWVAGPFAHAVGSSPVSVDDFLYFGAHSFGPSPDVESGLFALRTDGSERWRYVPGARHEGFGSSPAVVGRTLYVGGTGGTVYAFDL